MFGPPNNDQARVIQNGQKMVKMSGLEPDSLSIPPPSLFNFAPGQPRPSVRRPDYMNNLSGCGILN